MTKNPGYALDDFYGIIFLIQIFFNTNKFPKKEEFQEKFCVKKKSKTFVLKIFAKNKLCMGQQYVPCFNNLNILIFNSFLRINDDSPIVGFPSESKEIFSSI